MKILISDVDSGHANSLIPYIEAAHPAADITIHLDSLANSIPYAITNDFPVICRATTGLSDSRIAGEGMTAWASEIGIVHAHGANTHDLLSNPSAVGVICAVGCGNTTPTNTGSYGPGLEFFVDAVNQSYATASMAGMIAELMAQHSEWDFHDARQALRQTASNYVFGDPDDGHVDDGGWGLVDFNAADELIFLDYNLQFGEAQQPISPRENAARALLKVLPAPSGSINLSDRWQMLGIIFPGELSAPTRITKQQRSNYRFIFNRIYGRIN